MTELERHIQSFFGMEPADLKMVSQFFEPMLLKKGEYFLKTGRYSERMGFLVSGFIREFLVMESREITKWISSPGYFILELSSFVFQQEARFNIQALSDCELLVISYKDYQNLAQIIPRWAQLEKFFISRCFSVLEDRVIQHLAFSAEERYQQLFSYNKELFNQVPLQYLASMLGMSPETLSRMRKKALELNS
jgi:CRP-like cAMP-binding protein